jgi:hypothetical protein
MLIEDGCTETASASYKSLFNLFVMGYMHAVIMHAVAMFLYSHCANERHSPMNARHFGSFPGG